MSSIHYSDCFAVQHSDQMFCVGCNVTWDINDPAPPKCLLKTSHHNEIVRPTLVETFAEIVEVISKRSTCSRLKVGCLVANENLTSVVAIGYNGNARGLDNGCDTQVAGACGCIHAEENVLIKAPYGPNLILFCSHNPCFNCAKKILNSSVMAVYYNRHYRKGDGISLLRHSGIPCKLTGHITV